VDVPADRDRRIHFQEIRFGLENLSTAINNKDGLIFSETALTVEMLLEKTEIRFRWVIGVVELLVGGLVKGGSLYI
jgi:hypothetical protein